MFNFNVSSFYRFFVSFGLGIIFCLSVKGQNIVLSLLIHDKYFNSEIGIKLFKRLFEKADHYDDILVNKYGGQWKESSL